MKNLRASILLCLDIGVCSRDVSSEMPLSCDAGVLKKHRFFGAFIEILEVLARNRGGFSKGWSVFRTARDAGFLRSLQLGYI